MSGLLHQTLPRPYCERELLQLGSVNSLHGTLINTTAALEFSRGADGKVTVSQAGSMASAAVLRAEYVCGSILYVLDGYMSLLPTNSSSSLAGASELHDEAAAVLRNPPLMHAPLVCGNGTATLYAAAGGGGAAPSPAAAAGAAAGVGGLSSTAVAGIAIGASAGWWRAW